MDIKYRLPMNSHIKEQLLNLKDPSNIYIEIRTNKNDSHCLRTITTGLNQPYAEKLVHAILTYKSEIGHWPTLSQILFSISRNLQLEEESKE